ncbi:MAG: hypothetical protein JNK16_08155 [Phycisphaerales bacterium]|nr:hypothetical protein [Phycisphaerales bacterium]
MTTRPVVILVSLITFAGLARGADDTKEIKDKQIKCDGKLLATINLAFPIPYRDDDAKAKGVSVSGKAVATNMLKGELQWIQLIKTNKPHNTSTAAGTPYFDPGETDPKGVDYPFYWNYVLKARDGNEYPNLFYKNNQTDGGLGLTFSDKPTREYLRGAVDWKAELSLVCFIAPGKIGVLWSGTYGFNIDNEGNNIVNGYDELASPAWLTQAALDARFGKDKYALSTDCADCLVPAPGAIASFAFLGFIAARRRRAA